jgi:hypothetical protein
MHQTVGAMLVVALASSVTAATYSLHGSNVSDEFDGSSLYTLVP